LLRNGQIVIFGENQMVVGITHGKSGGKGASGATAGGAGVEKEKNGDQ
jgi:hypothetical protein